MGLKEDLERFKIIGEEEREDLKEFINHGNISSSDSDSIRIPVKIIDLPSFEYDPHMQGGVGQGEGEVGDPVEAEPQEGEGEGEEGEPGEDEGEHGHYEMDAEEFAQQLDDRLGLDLEPKGKKVKETTEGALVEKVRSGPNATVDFEELYKKGLKRELALYFDDDYVRKVMKVDGMGVASVFAWARGENIPVSKAWIEQEYEAIPASERTRYDSMEDIEEEYRSQPAARDLNSVQLREEDKRHKHPEITKEYEKNAVIIFIRDVSGSMGEEKRELVERVFTPLDWYLTGKYDEATFHYIAHDSSAEEVQRHKFFGMQSGGGTRISSAYELTDELLDEKYPWSEWNRYVFAAGDGENRLSDTEEEVIPLMEDIDCNLHGYVEVEGGGGWSHGGGTHADEVEKHFQDSDNVAVTRLDSEEGVLDSIEDILTTEEG